MEGGKKKKYASKFGKQWRRHKNGWKWPLGAIAIAFVGWLIMLGFTHQINDQNHAIYSSRYVNHLFYIIGSYIQGGMFSMDWDSRQ